MSKQECELGELWTI